MSDLLQFGRHPDADQLSAFVEHALADDEQQEMLAHLADCPECRAIVALSLPSVEAEAAPLTARKRWFSGWNLAWAAVPALAALALILVHVYTGSKAIEPAVAPVQMAEARPPHAPVVPMSAPAAAPTRKPLAMKNRFSSPQVDAVMADKSMPQAASGGATGSLFTPRGDNATNSFTANGAAIGGLAPAPQPIQLPMLSMVSKDHQRLAIDSQNELFLSNDDGRHWIAVSRPWQGRVVNVALTYPPAFAPVVTTGRNLAPVSPAPVNPVPVKKMRALPSMNFDRRLASSTLSGVVTDASGAAISGVTVTVTDNSAQVHSAKTDPDGHYRIGNLAPGKYQVEAQASGFQKGSVAVDLAPSQQVLADFKLMVGAATQSVEVTAASPVLSLQAESVAAPLFEITTESGEHWVSADGQNWIRK
jgi:hypothetical protein